MKRFLVLGFAAFAAVTLSAKSLVFTIDEGLLVYYLIGGEKNPVMTFTQDGVVVNTDAYEFSRIRNFYISETDGSAAIFAEMYPDSYGCYVGQYPGRLTKGSSYVIRQAIVYTHTDGKTYKAIMEVHLSIV